MNVPPLPRCPLTSQYLLNLENVLQILGDDPLTLAMCSNGEAEQPQETRLVLPQLCSARWSDRVIDTPPHMQSHPSLSRVHCLCLTLSGVRCLYPALSGAAIPALTLPLSIQGPNHRPSTTHDVLNNASIVFPSWYEVQVRVSQLQFANGKLFPRQLR